MTFEYAKIKPVKLRDVEKDERWLQGKIADDPSILGLGDLVVLQREKIQSSGGRIDFLMYEPEEQTRYEIEVMLGTLDESHIIRTIEYWDIERRRYPNFEHRAVIVAEDITNRFFNIISILNRSVPIIALQLNAFVLENKLVLNFVKILDLAQEEDPSEEASEQTDRKYWENRANKQSLNVMDLIIAEMSQAGNKVRQTYNKSHIAFGTIGRNFAWFHPRKGARLHVHLLIGPDNRETIVTELQEIGIESSVRGKKSISLVLTEDEFLQHKDKIVSVFRVGEESTKR
ncbi:MAG: hypothetical protein Q8L87_17790 [Anaerolineales bacterium]|nr:hypothetical protein [Anaerolineales bacterium]